MINPPIIQPSTIDEPSELDDEEPECRVCRGPAEEGRPLIAPCKCSGSIGLTHQDCLTSWLEVTRGDGRCELCSVKFRFAPKYSDDAPERLSVHEVLLGLGRRAVARWMPLAVRIVVAIFLWLLVVPLLTAYSYHGWMNRPSSIPTRWKLEIMWEDAISGAVVTAIIIVSFLSIMSLADFLRFNWHQQFGQRQGPGQEDEREEEEEVDANANANAPDNDIDEVFVDHVRYARQQRHLNLQALGVMDQRQPVFADIQDRWSPPTNLAPDNEDARRYLEQTMEGIPAEQQQEEMQRRMQAAEALQHYIAALEIQGGMERAVPADREEMQRRIQVAKALQQQIVASRQEGPTRQGNNDPMDPLAILAPQEEEDGEDDDEEARLDDFLNEQEELGELPRPDDAAPGDDRFEPQFEPLDPVMNQDDMGDMELNVALDELLGIRGPFGALIRNILWLLVFNAIYQGLFVFLPRAVGGATYRWITSTSLVNFLAESISWFSSAQPNGSSLVRLWALLGEESKKQNRLLQPSDLGVVAIGYCTFAVSVLLVNWVVTTWRHHSHTEPDPRDEIPAARRPVGVEDDPVLGDHNEHFDPADQMEPEGPGSVGEVLAMALECVAAVVKVGSLLFLKMFLLPLVLGLWLDVATLSLFDSSIEDRVVYTGRDLFASTFLHWVIGITFMLVITVSVLQLREVVHPDLLSGIIRPQEPQPDLLGNLLNEGGGTHARRIFLSFCIYAALLTIHVWLPARLLVAWAPGVFTPILKLRFCYMINSQLQIPVELMIFHLTMLGFLEKYKNNIGEMQYRWMCFMSERLGLTNQILPKEIDQFVLVGRRPIFLTNTTSKKEVLFVDESPSLTEVTHGSQPSIDEAWESLENASVASSSPRRFRGVSQVDPFWYNLAAGPKDPERFVSEGLRSITDDPLVYEPAKSAPNGRRTLVGSKAYIRLPLPASEQDVVDRKRRRNASQGTRRLSSSSSDVERKCLISTTQGPFRLRRRVLEDGTNAVEFWREVPGNVINRPPEGWDDLGMGGAEVQGRWAWGKERKSTIEKGVAVREQFFGSESSLQDSFRIVSKLTALAVSSWLSVSVVLCGTLGIPLVFGRLLLYLFRVPSNYTHDPFAFALGLVIFSLLVVRMSRSLGDGEHLGSRLHKWASRLRMPPIRKGAVFGAALFLWVFVAPFLLGVVYELLLVKPSSWFAKDSTQTGSLVLSWAAGTTLLNLWAALAYYNAFTREFWVALGRGAFEMEDGANQNDQEHPNDGDQQEATKPQGGEWQGDRGRIGRFFDIVWSILCGMEWDRVDRHVLFHEFLVPILKKLTIALVVPSLATVMLLAAGHTFGDDLTSELLQNGMFRMILFRSNLVVTILIQHAVAFRQELKNCFQVAHQIARDDKYLTGEILLGYSSEH